ncbi:MAG: shikimate dehydrogenase [Micavibrio sp.]|nr:shikimate dehydrogenase [Micavibrio sp.]|tara:strand:- start:1722 stop:2561 length:840 start_codon:yes stop_codon:yes gene_type:complete
MNDIIKAGVIGHPIGHSKSPIIHNHWIDTYHCKGTYEAIDIAPDQLKDGLNRLIDDGYAGFNVTVPHKQAVIEFCHDLDATALAVGAVNTVVIENGRLTGMNTDVYGFIENLRNAARNFGFSWAIERGPAVVLGTGGAARAAVYGLLQENVPDIILTGRTRDKALDLAKMDPSRITVVDWAERSNMLAGANLLVNATSLGMAGNGDLDMDFSSANPDLLVHDIVYTPLYTDFLRAAREEDLRILTGIGMLLYQAKPAFEAWFDVIPEVTQILEDKVLNT